VFDSLYVKAIILGLVEGVTEFLPISSTGHLILAANLLDFTDARAQVFQLVIQSGAMCAVVWEYRRRFGEVLGGIRTEPQARRFVANIVIGIVPIMVLGLIFGHAIKAALFRPVPVALAFILGGFIILWAERRTPRITVETVDELRWRDALKVGLAQAVALIPGTSRAGATIIGGLLFGLSRRAATEYSFFLAVPTLIAAGAYDLYRNRDLITLADTGLFAVGMLVSFFSAYVCIRWILHYIMRHSFTPFAWYRIAFGCLVLLLNHQGVDWFGRQG
jgi:undecaprenyl-diphosphatase